MIVSQKLPRYGTNMEEATIAKWHLQPGDAFKAGEPLYDIETEKVTTEVEAPCNGRLIAILANVGDIVEVGGVVCKIET